VRRMNVRGLCVGMASLLVVSASVLGANAASADSVQVQSYQRASQEQACSAQPGETPWQANWGTDSSWKPSWEQWANNGTGGWTCTRSITWAKPSVAGGSSSVTYRVGEIGPAGGTIFYIDLSRPAGSQYWEVGSDLGTAPWGCNGTNIPGAEETAIGEGQANTDLILANCATLGIAARLASAPAGGYSDWFLPSQDELNQVCKYARDQSTAVVDQAVPCNGTGSLRSGFPRDLYWTSTEYTGRGDIAWLWSFGGGYLTNDFKTTSWATLPVRSF